MAKKKTSVALPSGIKNLVHQAQGLENQTPAATSATKTENNPTDKTTAPTPYAPVAEASPAESVAAEPAVARLAVQQAENPVPRDGKDRSAPAAKKLPKAEGKALAKEYTLGKVDDEQSWQMFLDLAKEYKLRDSKLATVYIDEDLKSVLDRLKSAGSIKMPSTAILSSIVARFIFDHEKEIKNAIYGESLL